LFVYRLVLNLTKMMMVKATKPMLYETAVKKGIRKTQKAAL